METKDLVLLMLIPIILISLVIYTDKSPTIIGAVVNEPKKESNILGTYSINPSFKVKENYDLNDYNKIKESLDIIIKCAEEGKDIETCINEVNKVNSLTWQLNCDKGAEKFLYDFAEFYQDCFDSDDGNCLCRKNLELKKDEIQKYELANKIYRLRLVQNIQTQKTDITMISPVDLFYQIKINGRSVWYPSEINVAYSDIFDYVIMIFKYESQKQGRYEVPDKKEFLLYKHQDDNIKLVDFVKEEGNNLKYPNDDVIVDSSKNPIDIKNLDNCNIKPKNIYKFCVTQNNYKVTAYDALDRQVKKRNPVIKFASYVPDLPPSPLKNIEIFDKPKAEKSVLIKWDKSHANDVVKYNIYYGKSNLNLFEDKKTLFDIKKKEGFNKKEIDTTKTNPIELNQINLNSCEFDLTRKGCDYKTDKEDIILEKEKLYYSKEQNYYFYILTIEDGIDYDFSVTAVDKNGNEIDNIKDKLPIVTNKKSIDDLPPDSGDIISVGVKPTYDGSTKQFTFSFVKLPSKNIDDSELKDFKELKVYYKKYEKLDTSENKRDALKELLDSNLKNLRSAESLEKTNLLIKISLQYENLQANNVLYFFVIAFDVNGNPTNEQFKIKELRAQPIENVIP